jgi:hypothetical protein
MLIMNFCPYCGASLAGSAASFCSVCGQALPAETKLYETSDETVLIPARKEEELGPPYDMKMESASGYRKLAKLIMQPRTENVSPKKRANHKKKRPETSQRIKPDPDEGYDGYYNDVAPLDSGYIHDRMDPELIKRILYTAAGALAIIILSIILMNLL